MIIDLDDWEKLPTQKEVYYEDKTETLMFAAGLGSGKSYVLCRKLLKLSAINRNVAGGLLCPSYPDYKRDIEPMLETLLQENLKMTEGVHYKYNRSEKTWRFCWSKAPIYVFTADRPIAGPNLGYGGVNEFSLIPKDRMNDMGHRTECFDELLIEGNSNTQDMCRAIKARFPANMCILYPDASAKARKTSGKSDLQTLQDEGFKNIRFLSVNPSLRDRQLAMNGRFEKKTTMINPKCKTLIKDLKAVRQEADFTKNKKNPELTHASDSMDYFHMTRYHFNIDRAPKTHQF
jgi:hypothetical protein